MTIPLRPSVLESEMYATPWPEAVMFGRRSKRTSLKFYFVSGISTESGDMDEIPRRLTESG